MSAKRISRRTAERMLRGRSAGHPVARMLGSAAAPGRAEELSGEAEVLAAFRAAFAEAPVPSAQTEPHREASSVRSLLTKALTVKVAGAVLAVTAVGGVAIAAGGGLPLRQPDEKPKKQPAKTSAPAHTRKYAPPPAVPTPAATPSVADLCRRYLTQGRKNEHLEPLIKAAGGRKKAIALCVTLLGGDGDRPIGEWPTSWPSDWPKEWPKNQKWPTAWPTRIPEEWTRPPEGRDRGDGERRDRKAKGTAESRPFWSGDWFDLERP